MHTRTEERERERGRKSGNCKPAKFSDLFCCRCCCCCCCFCSCCCWCFNRLVNTLPSQEDLWRAREEAHTHTQTHTQALSLSLHFPPPRNWTFTVEGKEAGKQTEARGCNMVYQLKQATAYLPLFRSMLSKYFYPLSLSIPLSLTLSLTLSHSHSLSLSLSSHTQLLSSTSADSLFPFPFSLSLSLLGVCLLEMCSRRFSDQRPPSRWSVGESIWSAREVLFEVSKIKKRRENKRSCWRRRWLRNVGNSFLDFLFIIWFQQVFLLKVGLIKLKKTVLRN